MEILVGWGNRDAAQMQFFVGGNDFLGRCPFGRVDPGKADQLLREAADVVGDVAVGDFRLKIAALESKNDGFIDRVALGPMVIGIAAGMTRQTPFCTLIREGRFRPERWVFPKSRFPSWSGVCQICVCTSTIIMHCTSRGLPVPAKNEVRKAKLFASSDDPGPIRQKRAVV